MATSEGVGERSGLRNRLFLLRRNNLFLLVGKHTKKKFLKKNCCQKNVYVTFLNTFSTIAHQFGFCPLMEGGREGEGVSMSLSRTESIDRKNELKSFYFENSGGIKLYHQERIFGPVLDYNL